MATTTPPKLKLIDKLLGPQAQEQIKTAADRLSKTEFGKIVTKYTDQANEINRKRNEEFGKSPAYKIYRELKGQQENLGTKAYFKTGAASFDEGGYGSTDLVLKDMAERLAGAGLTSIAQFGRGPNGFINKETGEELTSLTGYRGQGWSGTGAGDGQTIYDVKFDASTGLPIFFNRQRHGKDDWADLLKIAAIGTAIFAPQIGGAILGSGASAAAKLAVGSAISGFVGSGGDLEAGIKSGLAGYLGGQAGSWASKAANSALVGNIAGNMTRTAILGGDMEQALVASLVQAAPLEISKYVPNFKDLPRAAQEAAVAATVDLMRTGGDNLGQIATAGAVRGATDYALSGVEGYKDLRPQQQEVVRTRVSNVLSGGDLSNELLQGAISFGQEWARNEEQTGGITNRVVDQTIPQGGVEQKLSDAGLTQDLRPETADQLLADLGLPPVTQPGSNDEGELVAGPSGMTTRTVASMPQMQARAGEVAGDVRQNRQVDDGKEYISYQREISYIKPDGTAGSYTINYDPLARDGRQIRYEYGGMDSSGNMQVFSGLTRPDIDIAETDGASFKKTETPENSGGSSSPDDFNNQITPDELIKIINDSKSESSGPPLGAAPAPTSPAPTPAPAPTPSPFEPPKVEPTVDELVKDLTPVAPSPTPTPSPEQTPAPTPTPPAANGTPSEVDRIVSDAIRANPNLTAQEVQKIISDATKGLATSGALDVVKSDLAKEIQAAKDIGLQGDAALQAGLNSLSAKMGVNQAEVLKQLGTSTDTLRKEFGAGLADVTAAQKAEADARAAQGEQLQGAITGVAGQVTGLEGKLTEQGKAFADQLVQQGMDYKTALQTAINAQSALFGTQIGGVQADIAANEARRIADQQAAAAAAEAQRQADQKVAAERYRLENIRTTATRAQTGAQDIMRQLESMQRAGMAPQPTQVVESSAGFDLSNPLNTGFFSGFQSKKGQQNQQPTTKIAAGGYIDDLLAGDMTADDLLNLLR
jgi:hypothetical protein